MIKITFMLVMLFCPSVFAATLTANTVPYVCQGGASPQLCNSSIVTDSSGNLAGAFKAWTTSAAVFGASGNITYNTIYQAQTDGMITGYNLDYESNAPYIEILTDSSSSPSTIRWASEDSTTYNFESTTPYVCFIRKGDYFEIMVRESYGFLANWLSL